MYFFCVSFIGIAISDISGKLIDPSRFLQQQEFSITAPAGIPNQTAQQ